MRDFHSKYEKTSSGCWWWKGSKNAAGYGYFRCNGGTKAHRASWIINFGPIPEGMLVCHKCDNPSYVNPEHLFLGTHKDNNADRHAKGRTVMTPIRPEQKSRGEGHGLSKLTDIDVRMIRGSAESSAALGRALGVTTRTIIAVRRRETWKHVI